MIEMQGFYFVWIKLINGVALAAIYGIIPALTVLFTVAAWPYERDRFVKPGPLKAILIICIVFLGVISYGAQLNFIFNRQPTPLMDEKADGHAIRIDFGGTEAHFALFTLKQYRSATVLATKGYSAPSEELLNTTVMAVEYISKLTGMSPRDILQAV